MYICMYKSIYFSLFYHFIYFFYKHFIYSKLFTNPHIYFFLHSLVFLYFIFYSIKFLLTYANINIRCMKNRTRRKKKYTKQNETNNKITLNQGQVSVYLFLFSHNFFSPDSSFFISLQFILFSMNSLTHHQFYSQSVSHLDLQSFHPLTPISMHYFLYSFFFKQA